ncbi:MAG: ribosomal protein S18-alanine N-acetyltransferase [Actinomycetota bacterium]|nr:ribosomal protein S18-alanine N-acetyltransferase [Actinomycetota bacterium]
MTSTRPAGADDLAALVAVERECFGASAWSEDVLASELADVPDIRSVLVAPATGEVRAYAVLMTLGEVADLSRIAVSPASRGQGLGRSLLAAARERATSWGCERMLLEVQSDNAAALALYAGAGFERIDVRRGYYGPGRDAVVMRLRL